MARSPSGKAEDCKSPIVGSIPTRASILLRLSWLKVPLEYHFSKNDASPLIFKYVIRNHYLMGPIFTLGLYAINAGLARGGFFGFESYPYESMLSLVSAVIAGFVILFSMRFVIDANE